MATLVTFNPRPRVERVPLANDQFCYVIDDAVLEPERLVAFAAANAEAFHRVDYNAYPGILLPTPGEISVALNDFFVQHIRRLFDARRIVQMHSRLALVTLTPRSLRPWQTLCHCDSVGIEPRHSIQASVLYLFGDAGMGGTSFYEPARPAREIALLFHDANTLAPEVFEQKHALGRGYMLTSNRYFRQVASVPAKWNRLIFYDGAVLHSGDIIAPEKLSADPMAGRLTLNGFFTHRRHAT